MLYTEIIAICVYFHTKHKNTLCGQSVKFWDVKLGGTYINTTIKGVKIDLYHS